MKNQYFGDNRDLFKYDLILHLIENVDCLNHFTFIPMLTEDDGRTDGNRRDYSKARAGTRNDSLKRFLSERPKNIREIKDFFSSRSIPVTIHKENEYFSHNGRDDYFDGIEEKLLLNSLIFVDPDNGLEVKRPNEKHVLYREVQKIIERMSKNSLLMIYQHFPRQEHRSYLEKRIGEIKDKTGISPLTISDNEIIFFFLAKDERLRKEIEKKIKWYKGIYPELFLYPSSPLKPARPKPPWPG